MEAFWWIVVLSVGYVASLATYRLTIHPLAKFPGPKLAAITLWYEAYYDIVQEGQYTWRIKQMHEQYGPIIRISPHELHINDPAFFEHIYRRDGRWDKYAWAMNGWAAPGATIFTADHYLHKVRRSVLNPYFSRAKVSARQGEVRAHVAKLCSRLAAEFADTGKVVNLGAAITAITRDVANDFVFRKHYGSLDREDFDLPTLTAGKGSGFTWRFGKHFPWYTPLLKSIPLEWARVIADDQTKKFIDNYLEARQDTKELMAAASHGKQESTLEVPHTVVGEIMRSKLATADKEFGRVFEDVSSIAGAGFETVAVALRLTLYHVLGSPDILEKLRDELTAAGIDGPETLELQVLEQLPYLTAVIMEGIRLSPAIASRMGRVAPDRDIFYENWKIPAGTPFGMTLILMHTDENLYPDPQAFKPERWTNSEARKRAEKSYAPFSRGTRLCLGMHLAWADLYMIIASLAQGFDWEFQGAKAEDFACSIDEFSIGTRGHGMFHTLVKSRQAKN